METMPNTSAHNEPHTDTSGSKLNWLRAAVLGANDGIVSVAAIVVGVAGATGDVRTILLAGVAGTIAGAMSMAVGEYVSVSTQRDTEKALIEKERMELETVPEQELEELTSLYEAKGLSRETAHMVAEELTAHDALAAHLEVELKIDQEDLTNPWHAGIASFFSFFAGAILPLLAIILPPESARIPITFLAVIVALVITGFLSAHAGDAHKGRAITRVVMGGVLAMAITYGIGYLFGVAGL